jgi:hypothetical protein
VDPLDSLPEDGRARWAEPREHRAILREALARAGAGEAGVPASLREREDASASFFRDCTESSNASLPFPVRDRVGLRAF